MAGLTINSTGHVDRARLLRMFPMMEQPLSRIQNFYTTPDRSACVVLETTSKNACNIYSLLAQDVDSLRKVMRLIIRDKDRDNIIVSLNLIRNRLSNADYDLLVSEFQFVANEHNKQYLVREPHNLGDIPYEIVPAFESPDKLTVVNNESKSNCYLARNIYMENLAAFQSKVEAEVFLGIQG